MQDLLTPLARLLGLEFEELKARIERNAIAYAMIAVLLVLALVFVLVGVNVALSQWLGPIAGPLVLAVICLVAAGIVLLVLNMQRAAEARKLAERRKAEERAALATSVAIAAVPALMRSGLVRKFGLPLGGALAAAYLLSKPGGYRDEPSAEGEAGDKASSKD